MNDFWAQLKDAEKEVEKVEEELKEAVEKKNEVLEALDAARREIDSTMQVRWRRERETERKGREPRIQCS